MIHNDISHTLDFQKITIDRTVLKLQIILNLLKVSLCKYSVLEDLLYCSKNETKGRKLFCELIRSSVSDISFPISEIRGF